jgi:hypothetical protein
VGGHLSVATGRGVIRSLYLAVAKTHNDGPTISVGHADDVVREFARIDTRGLPIEPLILAQGQQGVPNVVTRLGKSALNLRSRHGDRHATKNWQ